MSHFLLNHFLSTYFEGHVSIFQCTPDLLMFKAVIVEEKRIKRIVTFMWEYYFDIFCTIFYYFDSIQ